MSLEGKVRVNTHYTRSINLERDADSASVVRTYLPTSRATRTLEGMVESFRAETAPRAWSLVGPYGSGKSSFAVYLAHLLGQPNAGATETAIKSLQATDHALAEKVGELTHGSSGYFTVLLTGSPEPLGKRLVQRLAERAKAAWEGKPGRPPSIIDKLASLSLRKELPTTSEILECVEELQTKLAGGDYCGLLIVIDELGKFLEYEARHHGFNDIYLLQVLAEHTMKADAVKLSLVVMLHQAFEQYARGLGESLKNEWAKVQGRFENIPFLESSEQVLRVVAAAIEQGFNKQEARLIRSAANKMAHTLATAKALPGHMEEETAAELFSQCYPLHPVSALLLPTLCQKVAQNERTLFSYLGSHEQHGFQDSLARCAKLGDWIHPSEVFDYFILNQPAALTDHFTHRRWAEVVTAIERLGDAKPEESQLLKTIGLLNIIGAQGSFKASNEIIELCLPTKQQVSHGVQALLNKSIVQFRRFSAEYRVWQGSDFDLEARVVEELEKLGRFGVAEKLNTRHNLLPVVARRYTIENGALRYFVPVFVDAESYQRAEKKSDTPRIIFYLAENKEDRKRFHQAVCSYFSALDIVVLSENSDLLRDAVGEALALEEVRNGAQELNEDPVAQREFKERYAAAKAKEELLTGSLIDQPELSEWYWKAKPLDITEKREFQERLSAVLKEVYHACPVIKNELINRDRPSSQAAAARNKLALAMLNHEKELGLGFEKYPPEKAIYRSLLLRSRLHVEMAGGKWRFQGPESGKPTDDPCNFIHAWKRIDAFLDETEQQPKSLIEINKVLLSPPYGIKEGVLPILYLVSILANRQELAVYENRNYIPHLTEEQVERFLKRPDEFTVQRFRLAGLNHSIFQEYSKALFGDTAPRDVLSLARPIAQFIGALPEYTQKTTHGLSKHALAVRTAFKLAQSPMQFLLEGIPAALDINPREDNNEDAFKVLSERLTNTLRELKNGYPSMLDEMKDLLAEAFGIAKGNDLAKIRNTIYGRCIGLEDYTIDQRGQRPFLMRLTKKEENEEQWLENLLMFLGNKPSEKWSDTNRATAEYQLSEFTRKLNDLEKLRVYYEGNKHKWDGDFDVYLLRSIKKGATDYEGVVTIDSKRHEVIKEAKSAIQKRVSGIGDPELELALLAEIVDDFLERSRKLDSQSGEKGEPQPRSHRLA